MLLSSVLIVLREVLEISMILGILLALSRIRGQSLNWSFYAVTSGLVMALIYGSNMYVISLLADGVGQELINASLQILAFTGLLFSVISLEAPPGLGPAEYKLIPIAMSLVLVALIAREGSEIFVYMHGFSSSEGFLSVVVSGATIGALIGFSVGALLYYLLLSLPRVLAFKSALILLIFMGAGLLRQSIQQLMQADIIPSSTPVWNTSAALDEQSVMGQLLYATLGYEATPAISEVVVYFVGIVLMVAVVARSIRKNNYSIS